MAANDLSEKVSVVHRDVGLLQRGREVRPLGVNLVVTDFFDAGAPWLGLGFLVHRMGMEVRPLGVSLVVTDFFDACAPWLGLEVKITSRAVLGWTLGESEPASHKSC